MKTYAEDSNLANRYLIYDIQTHSFLPYETTGSILSNKQRYSSNYLSFLFNNYIETVYLSDNGVESIEQMNLPSGHSAADRYDDLLCFSILEANETVFHFCRIEENELEYLYDFFPSYYASTAIFVDNCHIVILENHANSLHYHYYRIEDDYSFTELGSYSNPLSLFVTDTRLAPTGEGSIPINISNPDYPIAMAEFYLPDSAGLTGTYSISYNGDGYFMMTEPLLRTFVVDENFEVVSCFPEFHTYFTQGNEAVACDGTTLLLGTLSEVPVVDGPLPPPAAAALRAWPNPFNPSTSVSFSLAQAGRAQLAVYNVRGQRVRTLVDDPLPAGEHTAVWNGRDDAGRPCASGVYLLRLQTGATVQTSKVLLLK